MEHITTASPQLGMNPLSVGHSVYLDDRLLMMKAASRVRGDRTARIRASVEGQKTISIGRFLKILDRIDDDDRQDGIHFRAIADFIAKSKR